MQKRYICFTCYSFHPEMKGVSEEEFKSGHNVCKEGKCKFKGQPLEIANLCNTCDKLFREKEDHEHFKQ